MAGPNDRENTNGFSNSSDFKSGSGSTSGLNCFNWSCTNTHNRHNSAFKEVKLHCETNNKEHHTSKLSVNKLIVRRGQPFNITLMMAKPFNPDVDQFTMKVVTGESPSEDRGTMSSFAVPSKGKHSSTAKAVWKAELQRNSLPESGILALTITPPADSPIGEYKLSAKHREEEKELANLSVLFNPWCPEDWVFLPDEAERQEYVMNQHGIIYKGTHDYISEDKWDFGQFDKDMVQICMKMLDLNIKHRKDPADDTSARCNPIYVSRVVTNMVNFDKNKDNHGVLKGTWSDNYDDYDDGYPPTHWSGSYAILHKWYGNGHKAVKYGQCWVFGGVMCSVMRLLGIPCRVVTNYQSAHDANRNLIIESYYSETGAPEEKCSDSVWNFHVWVEGWMKRPDLADDGRYDGWQTLDATPQEESEGMFCCGPAPVAAIMNGDIDLKYDTPFVFGEVNADRVTWMIRRDGSKVEMKSNTKSVGQCISTKAVGSNQRMDITNTYKHAEGTDQERTVFKKALAKLEDISIGQRLATKTVPESLDINKPAATSPQLTVKIEEESTPVNGQDVKLKLVLRGEGSSAKRLSINISILAITYTGSQVGTIQNENIEKELLPGTDLTIPIQVPYSSYSKHMVNCQTMNISAMVTDLQNTDQIYLGTNHVVLKDPPITIMVRDKARVKKETTVEVTFKNPVEETLADCTLTLSGTGIVHGEKIIKLSNLMPSNIMSVKEKITPYKSGEQTLLVNFDCASFRDIKGSCIVKVKPETHALMCAKGFSNCFF